MHIAKNKIHYRNYIRLKQRAAFVFSLTPTHSH